MEKTLQKRLLHNIALLLWAVLGLLVLLGCALMTEELLPSEYTHEGVSDDMFDGLGYIFIAVFLLIVIVLWWTVRLIAEISLYWQHTAYVALNLLMLLIANYPTFTIFRFLTGLG